MPELVTLVCSLCQGARWVCHEHKLIPWHVGHQHCDSPGTPCPSCNPGPEFRPWNEVCLDCAGPEIFAVTCREDEDVIFAELVASIGPYDIGDSP